MPAGRAPVPEAPLERIEGALVPAGEGWFVLNAREARWRNRPGRGYSLPFEGPTDFPHVGVALYVLRPGEPIGLYHWESEQEDFLVLAGEALLLIEGDERPLRQWDFAHCPPGANHIVVGAGGSPCVVLAVGGRGHHAGSAWGGYVPDELASRHGVGVEEETSDARQAYAAWAAPFFTGYGGWLPSDAA